MEGVRPFHRAKATVRTDAGSGCETAHFVDGLTSARVLPLSIKRREMLDIHLIQAALGALARNQSFQVQIGNVHALDFGFQGGANGIGITDRPRARADIYFHFIRDFDDDVFDKILRGTLSCGMILELRRAAITRA